MKIQLSSYFQQSLSKHQEIDRRLQPLFDVIKSNKINSVHQLSTDLQPQFSPLNSPVLSTIDKTPLKKANLKKYYSEQDKYTPEKRKSAIENSRGTSRKYVSKSANDNRPSARKSENNDNDQPLVYRGPNSKIKKHLIESMRFETLQALIKQKSSKSNRFKQFMEGVQRRRNIQTQRKHVSLFRLERVRLIDNEQAQEIFENCHKNDDSLFKVKIRKRFWKRDKSNTKEKGSLNNALCIKGMKNMAITIQ